MFFLKHGVYVAATICG